MKTKILFIVLLFSVKAYSQYEFKPGYIVFNDGTTAEGFIKFKSSESNSMECNYLKENNSDPVIYLPGDIKAYRLTNSKYFETKKVSIENNETVLFLECLISGKAAIYYTQRNSKDYFFLEFEGELHELNNHEVVRLIDGVEYVGKSHQYIGQLKNYLKDSPPVVHKLDNAAFSKKSLINISKEYHEYVCKDEQCIVYEKEIPRMRIRYGFDFSYGITKLVYSQNFGEIIMEPANHFQINLNSQIKLDEAGAFNLQFSLGYHSFKNELLNNTVVLSGVSAPNDVYYEFSILKPAIQLKYKFPGRKLIPFASCGFYPSIFLTDKGELYSHNFRITVPFTSQGDEISKGSMHGMLVATSELGLETSINPGNIFFSFYFEPVITAPMTSTYNVGLRCGYYFK